LPEELRERVSKRFGASVSAYSPDGQSATTHWVLGNWCGFAQEDICAYLAHRVEMSLDGTHPGRLRDRVGSASYSNVAVMHAYRWAVEDGVILATGSLPVGCDYVPPRPMGKMSRFWRKLSYHASRLKLLVEPQEDLSANLYDN